jgi:glycosyltransferase involved in cell wall biosynthesis
MRIAQIMAGAKTGGAEAFYERLTIAQHKAGEEVLPVIRRDAARAARLAVHGLAPVQLGFGGPLDVLTKPRLSLLLRHYRPQVAIAWMNRAARHTPAGDWTLVGRLGGYYDLKYYKRCDHLVGNTHDLVRWMVGKGWPAERAHYAPNFADDFSGALPVELGLAPGAPKLLALGRLHKNKGFDTLLRALALLPKAELAIGGDGPEKAALEKLAAELGVASRVCFLGWRQDAGALLAACDVFVCSSRHEPLGNIVLEAWSAAKPVVAVASQGPGELIEDGRTGLLVPQEAPRALADAIAGVLADPARAAALAAAGRAAWEAEFAEAPVLARWREVLQRIAPTGAKRG